MRSPSTLLVIVCAVLSTAAITVVIVRNAGPERSTAALEERVRRLEEAVAGLLSSPRHDPARDAAEPHAGTTADDIAAGGVTVESRLAALEKIAQSWAEAGDGGGNPEVSSREIERARKALDVIQREELSAQITRWVEREAKQSKELAAAMGKQLDLEPREAEVAARIFENETTAHGLMLEELWNAEPPADRAQEEALAERWDQAVVRMKELREERDRKLKELLGPERFHDWERIQSMPKDPASTPTAKPTGRADR